MTNFIVQHPCIVDWFCLLVPLFIALLGWLMQKRRKVCGRFCILVGTTLALIYCYGRFYGSTQLEVRHVEYVSADLPAAFDGYRIVQFSDTHVGSFTGSREDILRRAVDSINAQKADAVVFTGDLQNYHYTEIENVSHILERVKAPDGVYSVLGNHDYAEYMDKTDLAKVDAQLGRSRAIHEELGWHLLTNGWHKVRRDSSYIVISGMENDGEGRFPELGNVNNALWGINRKDFVVMLEHDPTAWRRKILPHCHAQLTLSGHTHGGQLNIFGWSPASLRYKELQGMYYMGDRALYVSKGLGAVLPFRLGAPGEIVVITLKCKKKQP